jgi:hypothetical protein
VLYWALEIKSLHMRADIAYYYVKVSSLFGESFSDPVLREI